MFKGKNGKKNWVFCDGDLPPHGDNPNFLGHEALMITNVGKKDAHITIKVIFEDKEPYDKITIDLKRGADYEKLMKKVMKMTPLEDSFSCNFNILMKEKEKENHYEDYDRFGHSWFGILL